MKIVVHVKTQEESEEVQKYAFSKGKIWQGGQNQLDGAAVSAYGEGTCLDITPGSRMCYGSRDYYEGMTCEIVEFEDKKRWKAVMSEKEPPVAIKNSRSALCDNLKGLKGEEKTVLAKLEEATTVRKTLPSIRAQIKKIEAAIDALK